MPQSNPTPKGPVKRKQKKTPVKPEGPKKARVAVATGPKNADKVVVPVVRQSDGPAQKSPNPKGPVKRKQKKTPAKPEGTKKARVAVAPASKVADKVVLPAVRQADGPTPRSPNPKGPAKRKQKKKPAKPKGKKNGRVAEVAAPPKNPDEVILPAVRQSDDPAPKSGKWTNRQRVLVFATRGITYLHRHLMLDLRSILPHAKKDVKKDKNEALSAVNDICLMKNCNKAIFFEARRKKDLFAWFANVPDGPSAKFQVENIHTMGELKLTGNCLKGSRALVTFSEHFDATPHGQVFKELITQIFNTPRYHPHSQPFVDHVFVFSLLDNKIWFRNYEINEESGALNEIGPRFVLNPIKIFEGSFGGRTLWENPEYRSPGFYRRLVNSMKSGRYEATVKSKASSEAKQRNLSFPEDEAEKVFG